MPSEEFRGKGFDTGIILGWLYHILHENDAVPPSCQLVVALVELAHVAISGICGGDAFLDSQDQRQIQLCGRGFQIVYVTLVHADPKIWRMRPKFHLLSHLFEEGARASQRNPNENAIWMDEDWVRRVARIIRRTHKDTSCLTVIQRYLLFLCQNLKTLKES